MKCTRAEKFLPLYVAGDLAGVRRRRAVEHHLAACEKCRLTAAEYQASRELLRAATLPPDFDAAFYEEIRNSVLARIRRDRTLAPPRGFFRQPTTRLAYAASLVLILLAAALALHYYLRPAHVNDARPGTIAAAHPAPPPTPATIKLSPPVQTENNERRTPRALKEPAPVETIIAARRTAATTGAERRAASSAGWRAASSSLPNSTVRRNPLAPAVAAPKRAPATEVAAAASGADATGRERSASSAPPEISRIEIQTSDPNIRIIWLAPAAEDTTARPLQ